MAGQQPFTFEGRARPRNFAQRFQTEPMNRLYSLSEVITATGGEARSVSAEAISSISIDSREIEPGALFVAIKGAAFDGHDFVAKAIEAGAVSALVSADKADGLAGLPLIVVPDALEGLNALARFSRARSKARITAVTGSVGKTSVKEAIRAVLSAHGRTHASIRSFNNHWGVPLMVARMPADTEYAVFEIGMNHAGEITPLSQLVKPHVAVITTVAPAHLEFFDSVAAIADAKAEIFAGLEPGGQVFVGHDHEHVTRLIAGAKAAGAETCSYGFDAAADVVISDYRGGTDGADGKISGAGVSLALHVPTLGRHTFGNAVGALLTARALGVPEDVGVAALARHGAPEGRGLAYRLGAEPKPLLLVDESYNANPASMRAALDVFGQMAAPGKRVLVLGDMRELGETADALHADLAPLVLAARPDAVWLVGAHMDALARALPDGLVAGHATVGTEIYEAILATLAYGDLVMIKGSNGIRLGALVAQIRGQFGQG